MSAPLRRGTSVRYAGAPTHVTAVDERPAGALRVDLEGDRLLYGPREWVLELLPRIEDLA